MCREQLSTELDKLFSKYSIIQPILQVIRLNNNLKVAVINNTNFLPEETTISERLYWLRNKDVSSLCKICSSKTKFVNFTEGYRTYCCRECISKDKEFINEKIKQTLLKNNGVIVALQSTAIKDKYDRLLRQLQNTRR